MSNNVVYMKDWVKPSPKDVAQLSTAIAALKALIDFDKGEINNFYPKHSVEALVYTKQYNELVRKNEH